MANVTFNLDNDIISFLKSYSIEFNVSQKDLVQEALKKLQVEKMRQKIRSESQDLWNNNKDEFMFLSESGLGDYNIGLTSLENGK